MKRKSIFFLSFLLIAKILFAQSSERAIPLLGNTHLNTFNVNMLEVDFQDRKALCVNDNGENSDLKFVKISDVDFSNGIIEVELAGEPAEGASGQARGFVGVAFRINNDNSKFEYIYLRPTNGRADDQIRRNHSVQYASFPDYPWFRLRKEFPEKYETYADLVPGMWTKLKIEIEGEKAKLYVHGNTQPTLIINDLKHGSDAHGSIGLWIGPGTVAHFSDLKITQKE